VFCCGRKLWKNRAALMFAKFDTRFATKASTPLKELLPLILKLNTRGFQFQLVAFVKMDNLTLCGAATPR
jgi:hypothetical protein